MPKNIGKTLKEYRIAAKISVKEISEILTKKGFKASEKTIYSWESGNSSPSPDALLAMCSAYNIEDVLTAFGYDGYNEDGSICLNMQEIDIIEKYRDLSSYDQETITQLLDRLHDRKEIRNIIEYHAASDPLNRFIPYQHSASAGSGIYILGNEAADQIAIPALPEYDDVDYAVKVNGHSMEPDFCDGEAALISQRKEMEIGDVGIFVKNGEVFIKELGETELISRNPDYPNIPVTENDNVVCLGKVIGKLQA